MYLNCVCIFVFSCFWLKVTWLDDGLTRPPHHQVLVLCNSVTQARGYDAELLSLVSWSGIKGRCYTIFLFRAIGWSFDGFYYYACKWPAFWKQAVPQSADINVVCHRLLSKDEAGLLSVVVNLSKIFCPHLKKNKINFRNWSKHVPTVFIYSVFTFNNSALFFFKK